MPLLQSPGVFGREFDAPEANALIADCDTSLGEMIFDISLAEV
jgi:hypothetical protein